MLWQYGNSLEMLQDNISHSSRNVLRGLHFQQPHGQGKLLTVLRGAIRDIVVDIRVGSPTYGKWQSYELSEENCKQLYIPPGLAHGFVVTGDEALVLYKCTDTYHPECEKTLLWNDPDLGIDWGIEDPIISDKDQQGTRLKDFAEEDLPVFQQP